MSHVNVVEGRTAKPLPLVVRALPEGNWNPLPLFTTIRKRFMEQSSPIDAMPAIRFGGRKSRAYRDVVYDMRQPKSLYDLAHKIIEGGEKCGDKNWRNHLDEPVVVVLPKTDTYSQAYNTAVFRACRAAGPKGERVITPVLTEITTQRFGRLRAQGEQIVLCDDFTLGAKGDNHYQLSITLPSQLYMTPLYDDVAIKAR